jgi:hypothetical protein
MSIMGGPDPGTFDLLAYAPSVPVLKGTVCAPEVLPVTEPAPVEMLLWKPRVVARRKIEGERTARIMQAYYDADEPARRILRSAGWAA